ncbi:MAG TPA: hypothetical protein VII95_03065 [Terriglobales bacterium]|jgi:hypothetical protein
MPEKEILERAREDAREGKAPSTQAGESAKKAARTKAAEGRQQAGSKQAVRRAAKKRQARAAWGGLF